MAQITGGKISFMRVRKDDDFGIKRESAAEFTFMVAEGEDANAITAIAQKLAHRKVHELLCMQEPALIIDGVTTALATGTVPAPKAAAPAAPKAMTDKEKLAAAAGAPAAAPKPTRKKAEPAPPPPSSAEDVLDEEVPAEEVVEEDELGEAAPEPVTDAALTDAVAKHNAAVANPAGIRELITKFLPDDKKVPAHSRNIPQASRHAFLKELVKVPKKA